MQPANCLKYVVDTAAQSAIPLTTTAVTANPPGTNTASPPLEDSSVALVPTDGSGIVSPKSNPGPSAEKTRTSGKIVEVNQQSIGSGCCPTSSCIVMAISRIIYDNDALNYPELLARASRVSPDLRKTIIELGSEGYFASELSGVVDIYECEIL